MSADERGGADERGRDATMPATPSEGRDPWSLRDPLAALVEAAGRAISEVYASDFTVELKADASPVTEADLRSQAILKSGLAALTPGVPLLAEEGAAVPYAQRRSWTRLWCVDPLDGTRDFVAGTGEFSVNVALVERGRPVLGMVHAPVTGVTYVGGSGHGAWRRTAGGPWRPVRVAPPTGRHLRVFVSRQHAGPRTMAWLATLADDWEVEVLHHGSALKACLVADGSAHLYPRLGRSNEWDTAAAQAVLEAAGGVLCRAGGTEPLRYNKPDLRNPGFYAAWGPEAPHP